MREQKVKYLRRLVARNWARVEDCCSTDTFKQVCPECLVHYNLMSWALHRVALRFKKKKKSKTFLWDQVYLDNGALYTVMKARTTREKVCLYFPAASMERGKRWFSEQADSAKKLNTGK